MTDKRINIDGLLQMRRPLKALSLDCCTLCMGSRELIDHLSSHQLMTLELWHKLFRVAKLDWVPPRSINDMMIISFRGLGTIIRGKVLFKSHVLR